MLYIPLHQTQFLLEISPPKKSPYVLLPDDEYNITPTKLGYLQGASYHL